MILLLWIGVAALGYWAWRKWGKKEDLRLRVIIGFVAFIVSAYLGYIFAFAMGVIFLPELGIAAFLGFVGGFGGGYFTKAGWRAAVLVGLLGGVFGATVVARMDPYNPIPGGIPLWTRVLKGFIFIFAGGVGGLVGEVARGKSWLFYVGD